MVMYVPNIMYSVLFLVLVVSSLRLTESTISSKVKQFKTTYSISGNEKYETYPNVSILDPFDIVWHVNYPEVKSLTRLKRDESDAGSQRKSPLMCPSHEKIDAAKNNKVILNHFQGNMAEEYVTIRNRIDCCNVSEFRVDSPIVLDVMVDNCCTSNCVHFVNIESERAPSDTHFLLNFLEFNVPGQNYISKTGEKTCTEALDIVEVYASNTNESLLFEKKIGSYCGLRKPDVVYIEHGRFKFSLKMIDNKECIDKIILKVILSPCSEYPHQSCDHEDYHIRSQSDQGYILTPGFESSRHYPNNLDCRWEISVPEDKLVLLNVSLFRLEEGEVVNISIINSQSSLQSLDYLTYSKNQPLKGQIVLPSNSCTIDFKSDEITTDKGFLLSYNAVERKAFTPIYTDGSLNCSGLDTIPESIKCDFVEDCKDGQDENSCPYKHPDCPAGYVNENRCYRVVNATKRLTSWISAADYCKETYKASLISFRTVAERQFLDKMFDLLGIRMIFLGLERKRGRHLPQMYKRLWEWTDGTTAFYLPNEFRFESWSFCAIFNCMYSYFYATECRKPKEHITTVCENLLHDEERVFPQVQKQKEHNWSKKLDVFTCESGELVSIDQRCDGTGNCFDSSDERNCEDHKEAFLKMFLCGSGERIGYSFVCNGILDCFDESDETFCTRPDEKLVENYVFSCRSGMQIDQHKWCDGIEDCFDSSDEESCETCSPNTTLCPSFYCMPGTWDRDGEIDCPIRDWRGQRISEIGFVENLFYNRDPPGIIHPDGFGKVDIEPINKWGNKCPLTHFQCLEGFCIPIYLLCNKIVDCPHGEDEIDDRCREACSGAYKCRRSSICIHFDQVCDGQYNCPLKDDEMMCVFRKMACPNNCECMQSEVTCSAVPRRVNSQSIQAHSFKLTGTTLKYIGNLTLDPYSLIRLNVSSNLVVTIDYRYFVYPNLLVLDFTNNQIQIVPSLAFQYSQSLMQLILARNDLWIADKLDLIFLKYTPKLKLLDLSENDMKTIYDKQFAHVPLLETLILRDMKINHMKSKAFNGLKLLKNLDLTGNELLQFSSHIFEDQKYLAQLTTDNFRLCCEDIAPESISKNGKCVTTWDEISSCEDMLRSNFLRAFLWIMAILTISGNIGVICQRIFWDRSRRLTFRVLITCLAMSDLIMGVYLVIIGTADLIYRERFLSKEQEWKESLACQVAGYLCVLSSEVSAFFILVVTVDRTFAIVLPFRRGLQLTNRSVGVVCVLVWTAGMIIASIPLVPPFNSWELYSQLAVGVPLPLSRNRFSGIDFSFAIFIVLNMIIFLCVAIGQVFIWVSIKRRSHFLQNEARTKQDLVIAQRLFLVVLTDCLCWFPIGVMGLMAYQGVPVPGTMYIVSTVFLLPANSALNPFLYTINALIQKRRERNSSAANSSNLNKNSS